MIAYPLPDFRICPYQLTKWKVQQRDYFPQNYGFLYRKVRWVPYSWETVEIFETEIECENLIDAELLRIQASRSESELIDIRYETVKPRRYP